MMRLLMSILLKIRPDLINSILSFNILLISLLILFIKDDNEFKERGIVRSLA